MQNFCVLTETFLYSLAQTTMGYQSWRCHFCVAIKVDVRSLQAFNTSEVRQGVRHANAINPIKSKWATQSKCDSNYTKFHI